MTYKSNNQLGNSCYNDFNVFGNTGATRSVTISNAHNAANTSSSFVAQVSGAAAGDPYYRVAETVGGQNWVWGLDNSALDKFVISSGAALGTNDVMEVFSTGEINYPKQPCFSAYKSVNTLSVTGNGAVYTVICDAVTVNQGACYNNATGVFTAPVTGNYFFQGNASIINALGVFAYYIEINPSIGIGLWHYMPTTPFGDLALNLSGMIVLTAGSTVTLKIIANGQPGNNCTLIGGAATQQALTGFCGWLVC